MVEFDVVVTISEDDKAKGGAGIFIGGLGIGVQGQTASSNMTVNRIKFSVPVYFPPQTDENVVRKKKPPNPNQEALQKSKLI